MGIRIIHLVFPRMWKWIGLGNKEMWWLWGDHKGGHSGRLLDYFSGARIGEKKGGLGLT